MNRDADYLYIDPTDWDRLTWYAYHLISAQFQPMILDTAIVSPFFLAFYPAVNAFEETPFHRAILTLRDQIRRFNDSNNPETLSVVYENSPKQRFHLKGTLAVEPKKLAMLIHLFDRWINIIELCIALYRHLDGKPFVEPSLRSSLQSGA